MKKILYAVLIPVILTISFPSYADQYSSSPFNNVEDIAVEGDLLWCATYGGAIEWNKVTGEYKTYTPDPPSEGLYNSNYLRFVEVDQNGVKWFGSNAGLFTFDGETWEHVIKDGIYDIYIDSGNGIWIIIQGSVRRVNTDTGEIIYLQNYSEDLYGLRCCAEAPDGTMWFGSSEGVYRLDGDVWDHFTFDEVYANDINDITVDKDGTVWVLTNGEGIMSYNGFKWTEENWLGGSFDSVCFDGNNVKWFAGSGYGLSSYDNTNWEFHNMDGLYIRNLFYDGNIVWGCVSNKGLFGFNDTSQDSLFIPPEKIQNIFTSATVTSDNTKWFGSDGFGVYSLNNEGSTSYTTDDGLPSNTIIAIGVDDGDNVWAEDESGKYVRYDGESWQEFGSCPIFLSDYQRVVVGNETWSIEYAELTRTVNNESSTIYEDRGIRSIAADNNGHIWIGGRTTHIYETVSNFDGEKWTTFPIEAKEGVIAILADKNNTVWFCTDRSGIWSYDGYNWKQYSMSDTGLTTWNDTSDSDLSNMYFPLTVGDYWLYKHSLYSYWEEEPKIDNLILTIVGLSEIDNQTYYKFLDGKRMRVGDEGNVYKDGILYYDFTPTDKVYSYITPGYYVLRSDSTKVLPIGTSEGKYFQLSTGFTVYGEFLMKDVGLAYFMYGSDTGQRDIFELSEAYVNGKKISDVQLSIDDEKPVEFLTLSNSPNPFNPSTTIHFTLPEDAKTTLEIYNATGQKIETLCDDILRKGSHSMVWNGSGYSSGIYFSHLTAGEMSVTRKMLLLK